MLNPKAKLGEGAAPAGDSEVLVRQAGVPIWNRLPLKACKKGLGRIALR
jgi:hypothetical protein